MKPVDRVRGEGVQAPAFRGGACAVRGPRLVKIVGIGRVVRALSFARRREEATMSTSTTEPPSRSPARPIAATIAAVIRDGQVLLVRRANPPDAGRWAFPGGKIEQGETIPDAAIRELREETGVRAKALGVFTAVDDFDRDDGGTLRRHFILIAVLCRWVAGEPVAGDDARDARWFGLEELDAPDLALSLDVAEVARQAAVLMHRAA